MKPDFVSVTLLIAGLILAGCVKPKPPVLFTKGVPVNTLVTISGEIKIGYEMDESKLSGQTSVVFVTRDESLKLELSPDTAIKRGDVRSPGTAGSFRAGQCMVRGYIRIKVLPSAPGHVSGSTYRYIEPLTIAYPE
jgi:hypothetical protein